MKADYGNVVNLISMISLLVAAAFLIFEGIRTINLKKKNPKMPKKMYTLATICFLVAAFDIIVAFAHIYV